MYEAGLNEFIIEGVKTMIPFHLKVYAFLKGEAIQILSSGG